MGHQSKKLDSVPETFQGKLNEVTNFNQPDVEKTPLERIQKLIKQLQDLNHRVERLSTLLG